MPFDPDAYLAAKPTTAFDPDAYLAGSKAPEAEGPVAPTREQEIRRDALKRLLAAQPEPGYTARIKDAVTMGLSRPLGGAMSVLGGEIGEYFGGKPATAGERWRGGVGAEDDYAAQAVENTKGPLGTAVDVVGGLAAGGPAGAVTSNAAKIAVGAPSRLAQITSGALTSAGQGALEGAARNSESVGQAGTGAAVGGAVGGVTGGLIGALANRLKSVQGAKKEVSEASRGGSSETLKEEGGAIYKKLDNAGISFKDTPALAQRVADKIKDKGFNEEIHKELVPVLKQIENAKAKPGTWTEIQNLRTQLSDAKASPDKRVRKMAGEVGNVLDDFIEHAKPTMPARSVGQVNVGEDAKTARDLWRRGSQAENAEYLADKGMTTSKDPVRKLEQNFGSEIDRVTKPGRFNPNTPEQMDLMTKIAQGDPKLSGASRSLERWGNNLLGYGTAGAVGGAGLPFLLGDQSPIGSGAGAAPGALAIGAGLLSKRGSGMLARKATERGGKRVDDLIRNIVTGSTDMPAIQNVPREALAKVLAVEQLKRSGARYTGSLFDNNKDNRK
jgi:hypothetical protein